MHDRLYEARGALETPDLVRHARDLGLDAERVAAELASGTHVPRVRRDADGGRAGGVAGTPGFFTNGRLQGAYDAGSLLAALESTARPAEQA
jgi:predicted DsbA family dithiol-disulfide isomerase